MSIGSAKVVTKDSIRQLGLAETGFLRRPSDLFSIVVIDHDGLVLGRKCPEAHVAVQAAPLTSGAFCVIALLAERLPVVVVVGPIARPRDAMVGREFDGRFLLSAVGTSVVGVLLDLLPQRITRFCARFSLLADIKRNELVPRSLFDDARQTFFTLKFAHPPKHICVGQFASCFANLVDVGSYLLLTHLRARDSVTGRPKQMQNLGVDLFEGLARSNESVYSVAQPLLTSSLVRHGSRSWWQKQSFTCPGFGDQVVRAY